MGNVSTRAWLHAVIKRRLHKAKCWVNWLGKTPCFSPWFFQFLTWLQYVSEAMLLYCTAAQQKRPYSRLQVTRLNFPHFRGFRRFTWTADSWFNIWQCQLKDTFAFYMITQLENASLMDLNFLSSSEIWSLMMTRQHFGGTVKRTFSDDA